MQQFDIARQRRAAALPLLGGVKAGPNGELTFTVTIQPELLDKAMNLVQAFAFELRRAGRTRDFWKDQRRKGLIDCETGRIEARARRRLSLSVYRKTGDVKLAAKAGGWGVFDMRAFIQDAKVAAAREKRAARNRKIYDLKKAGLSCRDISKLAGISAGQVCRIVNAG